MAGATEPRENSPVLDYAPPAASRGWVVRARPWVVTALALLFLVILAIVVVPVRNISHGPEAKITAAKADIAVMGAVLETFNHDCGHYPTTSEGIAALLQAPPALQGWRGPYLDKLPMDPWGRPYVYQSPGTHNPTSFDLSSLGPDGIPSADDITNWP
jgi:general secretion pathway protein G